MQCLSGMSTRSEKSRSKIASINAKEGPGIHSYESNYYVPVSTLVV